MRFWHTFSSRMLRPPLGLWLAIGLILCGSVQAQWKWRDGRGQLQYSDLPPPASTPEQDILQRPPTPPVSATPKTAPTPSPAPTPGAPVAAGMGAASAATMIDPALEARRKQLEQQEAAKRKADEALVAQQRASICERAQTQLRTLESGQRIAHINAQGERVFMDDQARSQETNMARQLIDANCR